MKFKSNKSGITLVALIVTIIILLILAGISITSLTKNGLFEKAKLAKEKQEISQTEEDKTLKNYENKIENYVANDRQINNNKIIRNKLTDNNIEIPVSTNFSEQQTEIILNDSIENYTYLEFNLDLYYSSKWWGEGTQFLAVEQIDFCNTDIRSQVTSSFLIQTLSAENYSQAYYSSWFKDNRTLKLVGKHAGRTEIKTLRIRSIYGIKI